MSFSLKRAVRRGLTLIELVVVLAILATLAAIVVPRLDFLKGQAEHATAAATTADLTSMLQTQKTSTGSFPSLDLLVDTSGAVYSKVYSGGGMPISAFTVTPPGAPGSDWYRSLLEGGLLYGLRHNAGASNASDSASTVTDLVSEGAAGTLTLATLNGAGYYASSILSAAFPGGVSYGVVTPAVADDPATTGVNEATPAVMGWIQSPAGVIPDGVKLVAMGIGPKNSMMGNTISSTPLETDTDDSTKTYCRYIAIFAVYGSGKPAQLKMVVDHRFKQLNKHVDQYKSAGATGI